MSAPMRRVLVLGGYGSFGGRLVELISASETLEVLVAGRSYEKASRFCASLDAKGSLRPIVVDRNGDIGATLDRLAPDLVIDASGPFQTYGREPYRVVVAAIERGIHYADLADSAEFVRGISRFDTAARSAGVFVLSGLSTYPALTAAAVRWISSDMRHVDSISAGIAPSAGTEVGESVIRAVATYAGKPIGIRKDGKSRRLHALTDHRNVTVGFPGGLPLQRRRFSLVDVPDLELLGDTFPGIKEVWVGAAISPPILHRALNVLAQCVRWHLLPSLVPFVKPMHRLSNWLKWGERRGGMFVTASGRSATLNPIERSWHLVASGSRGAYIPTIAAAAVVSRCSAGQSPAAGARSAVGELAMQNFDRYFSRLGIEHGVHEQVSGSLFQRMLKSAWPRLPVSLRRLHDASPSSSTTRWRGVARVTRGKSWFARLICAMFRFPRENPAVELTVKFQRNAGRETWLRNFGGRRFLSVMHEGHGAYDGLLCERFGPLTFGLAVVVDGDTLRFPVRRWDILGLRLPLWLGPKCNTQEFDDEGVSQFSVEINMPVAGLVVRYEGYLEAALSETRCRSAPTIAVAGFPGEKTSHRDSC